MHVQQRGQPGRGGFTLIELLIVIAIIGFLAAAVLVAVDPVKRIQDARDARRSSEANAILNAILTKQVDDRAYYPGNTGTGSAPIITQTGANVQVIVTSDTTPTAIVCNAPATRPGCNKAMDTTGANKNCVVNLSDTFLSGGTATSAAAVVTGTGTAFTTDIDVGDTLTSASGGTGTVLSVASATSLTLTATPSIAFSGALTILYRNSLSPNYIASIPRDPRTSGSPCVGAATTCTTRGDLDFGTENTGYYLARTAGNRIEVGACSPEQAATISVKR